MSKHHPIGLSAVFVLMTASLSFGGENTRPANPFDRPNLAPQAVSVQASSVHSERYKPAFAIDGIVPEKGGGGDADRAWCVDGSKSKQRASFTLEWETPITAAEIVYHGRTAFYLEECWKDYEILLDGSDRPAAKGKFQKIHGPQRISFPPTKVKTITIRFLSSYGGPNPGASEITVYANTLSEPESKRLESLSSTYDRLRDFDCQALERMIQSLPPVQENAESRLSKPLVTLHKLTAERERILSEIQRDPQAVSNRLLELVDELDQLKKAVMLHDVDRMILIERHEINASHVYTYHYEGFKSGGGIYIYSPHSGLEPQRIVDAGEGQILDCDLSYDAKMLLFSWRKREDQGYHLFTVNLDGSALTQLTDGPWHDYNACWLPDGGIAFISSRSARFAYCWHAPVGVLYRMNADGENAVQLSYNIVNDFTPCVLPDGRILYTRWEYVDKPAIPIQSLWTIRPDGTGLSGYYGNRVITPGTLMEARPVPGSNRVICTLTGHNGPTRGAIGIIDRSKGINAQEAIWNLTPEVDIGRVDRGNGNMDLGQWGHQVIQPYCNPYPLDERRFLVSKYGTILVRDYDGTCEAEIAKTGNEMWYYHPKPIRPRPMPPALPQQFAEADRSDAYVFLQDVYNGLEPHVKRGEIKEIVVVEEMKKTVRIGPELRAFGFQFPVISCGATYAGKRVLGTVPVEADGSAYFTVPTGKPIYFMALDEKGRTVQRMRSFTHLMPGETQGCIGCHEHRLHTSRPTQTMLAMARSPKSLTPPEWGTEGFDYSRIVQPVLDRHCVECHDSVDPPNGIDLTGGKTDYFNVSYDILARENQGASGTQYVNWIPTYNGQEQNILEITPKAWGSPRSRLAEVVLSGHPGKKGKPRIQLAEWERRRVLAWIDLNVPYYGTPETAYPEKQGCRRMVPPELDRCINEVAQRRCVRCHKKGIPRREWLRVSEPEFNDFLMAPLAKKAGGRETCGESIFANRNDPDYQAILQTFDPILAELRTTPRMDMPGAVTALNVNRSCK